MLIPWEAQVLPVAIADLGVAELGGKRPGVLIITFLIRTITGLKKYEVQVYNDPIIALSEFKRDFYDLLLVDINMPKMNGFEFAKAVLALDVNVKLCFMSSGHINQEALRELYPAVGIGCFIIKPVTLDDLIKRVGREIN